MAKRLSCLTHLLSAWNAGLPLPDIPLHTDPVILCKTKICNPYLTAYLFLLIPFLTLIFLISLVYNLYACIYKLFFIRIFNKNVANYRFLFLIFLAFCTNKISFYLILLYQNSLYLQEFPSTSTGCMCTLSPSSFPSFLTMDKRRSAAIAPSFSCG